MPTLTTPPDLERRPRLEDSDLRVGGRPPGIPPTDKRTGGGGRGDGDDEFREQPVGKRGPRERLGQFRIGLGLTLGADLLFFIGIIASFIATRSSYHFDAYNRYINDWLPVRPPSILWLNTAVLLLSSASAEFARRIMFREHEGIDEWLGLGKPISRRAGIWLIVTLALGTLFLLGQWAAWQQLAAQHVRFASGAASHFFYIITVAHALHLFLGITGILAALAALRASRQFATRQLMVDVTVWYWHAMGLLWIFLFILLEFFQ